MDTLLIFYREYVFPIENFIIIQKIELKVDYRRSTLTEVSYKLNYSSVAYLSSQFKKVTD
jgi:AraC-like DNA-binding protein